MADPTDRNERERLVETLRLLVSHAKHDLQWVSIVALQAALDTIDELPKRCKTSDEWEAAHRQQSSTIAKQAAEIERLREQLRNAAYNRDKLRAYERLDAAGGVSHD